jgi:hypothetical protein
VLQAVQGRVQRALLYPPYAFDDAATALQDIADRKVHGKVVVTQ